MFLTRPQIRKGLSRNRLCSEPVEHIKAMRYKAGHFFYGNLVKVYSTRNTRTYGRHYNTGAQSEYNRYN